MEFTVAIVSMKLAPALAAGNTAVIKPSEYTSASTLEFMELIEEAGFPTGVVNAITGFGLEVGAPLVDHPQVDKVAFTGSDVSGQKIYEAEPKKSCLSPLSLAANHRISYSKTLILKPLLWAPFLVFLRQPASLYCWITSSRSAFNP